MLTTMKKITYKKQLLIYFTGIFFIFAAILVFLQLNAERRYKTEILQEKLSTYTDIIAQSDNYEKTCRLFPEELRISVIDKKGKVLFDSQAETSTLDNHISRPEIQQSLNSPEGLSVRTSNTTGIPYLYIAKSYRDFIIRAALPYEIGVRQFMKPDILFLVIVFLLFTITLFSLVFLSGHFGQGISKLRQFAEAASKGNADNANLSFPNSELGEIGDMIQKSYNLLAQSNRMIALEKERLLLHIYYYNGGIAIFSPERRKIYSNQKFIQLVNTLLGKPTPDLNDIWTSEAFMPLDEFLQRNIPVRSETPPVFNFKLVKGGKNYEIQMIIYSDSGFEITINDISETEKNKIMKQQMTNNISHELRTPVSSIRGYLETLITCKNISEDRKNTFIERAYAQAMRLSDIIRDIAIIAKIEEAPELLEKEDVYLKKIVDELAEEFKESLESHRIHMTNNLPADLKIYGNHSLLYAIFRNLIENSIKYAGNGIEICISCFACDDGYCHLTYYDTGTGIDEQYLSKIFERFYRASEGRTRDTGGSGLGLSIVRNAIAYHGGDISAINRKEGGLQFIFSLSIK